jgi:hypothetical protein
MDCFPQILLRECLHRPSGEKWGSLLKLQGNNLINSIILIYLAGLIYGFKRSHFWNCKGSRKLCLCMTTSITAPQELFWFRIPFCCITAAFVLGSNSTFSFYSKTTNHFK